MSAICIFSARKPNFLPVQWSARCRSSPLEATSWPPSPCPALALKASEAEGGVQPPKMTKPRTPSFSVSECCRRWGWGRGCFDFLSVEGGKRLSPVSGPRLPPSVAQRFGIPWGEKWWKGVPTCSRSANHSVLSWYLRPLPLRTQRSHSSLPWDGGRQGKLWLPPRGHGVPCTV